MDKERGQTYRGNETKTKEAYIQRCTKKGQVKTQTRQEGALVRIEGEGREREIAGKEWRRLHFRITGQHLTIYTLMQCLAAAGACKACGWCMSVCVFVCVREGEVEDDKSKGKLYTLHMGSNSGALTETGFRITVHFFIQQNNSHR